MEDAPDILAARSLWFIALVAWAVVLTLALCPAAIAAGPGGWDHLGDGGTPGTASLNGAVYALEAAPSLAPPHDTQTLYVGGSFTSAGGNAAAARIAQWNGDAVSGTWSPVGAPGLNGDVRAIAYADGKLYVGGNFTNAGGNPDADFLAVWDGVSWAPFCSPTPAFNGSVLALQVIGPTLYVGGVFLNGGGIASADALLACNLTTGVASSTVVSDGDISGGVYALTADNAGTLYAGGQFINMAGNPAADHVAAYNGTWHAMGTGPSVGGGAVDDYVRSLASSGTDVYIGTDSAGIASIPQADHVARWNGSAWSALGANAAGTLGWLPTSTLITSLLVCQTCASGTVYVGGTFQNADGNPLADNVAAFDGTQWLSVGSNGVGNGPLMGNITALASYAGQIVAGGNFTSAGTDPQASSIARTTPPAAFVPPPPTPQPLPSPPLNRPQPVFLRLGANALKVSGTRRSVPARLISLLRGCARVEALLRPRTHSVIARRPPCRRRPRPTDSQRAAPSSRSLAGVPFAQVSAPAGESALVEVAASLVINDGTGAGSSRGHRLPAVAGRCTEPIPRRA